MKRKHSPQIVEASRLADVAIDQADGEYSRFPEVLTADGEFKLETKGQWFACVWGDNCVTTQHLGDATIHGPFDTESEAAEYVSVPTAKWEITGGDYGPERIVFDSLDEANKSAEHLREEYPCGDWAVVAAR